MEHVELETLDREHTASNKKDPQLNHEKKPTKKIIQVLKLIGTKTLLFAFIIPEILRQYFINHPQSIDKYTFLQNSAFTHWVKEKCSKMC